MNSNSFFFLLEKFQLIEELIFSFHPLSINFYNKIYLLYVQYTWNYHELNIRTRLKISMIMDYLGWWSKEFDTNLIQSLNRYNLERFDR